MIELLRENHACLSYSNNSKPALCCDIFSDIGSDIGYRHHQQQSLAGVYWDYIHHSVLFLPEWHKDVLRVRIAAANLSCGFRVGSH